MLLVRGFAYCVFTDVGFIVWVLRVDVVCGFGFWVVLQVICLMLVFAGFVCGFGGFDL